MKVIPMLSWEFIFPGQCYLIDSGERVPLNAPTGVELQVQSATKTGAVLRPDRPWECNSVAWGQVLEEDGLYRMWYGTGGGGKPPRLCYAESKDAMEWHKPALGLVEIDGSSQNNVVLDTQCANHSYVFVDPTAEPDSRYRCMMFRSGFVGQPVNQESGIRNQEWLDYDEGLRRYLAKNEGKGVESEPISLKGFMVGLNSPDGLHWTEMPDPILDEWHDTHNICNYDEERGKYVAYLRGFYGGRRATCRSETDNFAEWPPSQVIHHNGAAQLPDASIYSNGYTRYPGNRRIHLMFPAFFHQATDHVDAYLSVSQDGLNWTDLFQQPIIPCGSPGEEDEAYVYPEPELLRFSEEGKFRLLLRSGNQYHDSFYFERFKNLPYKEFYQWAEWPEDRLAGIHAAEEGSFTLPTQNCGRALSANFVTEPGGWIQFELVDRIAQPAIPLPGISDFQFDEMSPMSGDELRATLSWAGQSDLSALGQVAIRVRMSRATLFAIYVDEASGDAGTEHSRFAV